MKGIILTVTIALAVAIGGAASGQTKEEVEEIIKEAKEIGLAKVKTCHRRTDIWGNPTTADWKTIGDEIKSHYQKALREAKITDSQLYEEVCRRMRAIHIAQTAKQIETDNLKKCQKKLNPKEASELENIAEYHWLKYTSIFPNWKVTKPQHKEATCRWFDEHGYIESSDKK